MPHATRRFFEHIDNDIDVSASISALQLPVASGTRAPQSTPAGGNTPRNNTPRNNSPGDPIDPESYAYGKVITHYGGPDVAVARERIRIELNDGKVVELLGQKARDATGNLGPAETGLDVQVTYFGVTNEVKEIRHR